MVEIRAGLSGTLTDQVARLIAERAGDGQHGRVLQCGLPWGRRIDRHVLHDAEWLLEYGNVFVEGFEEVILSRGVLGGADEKAGPGLDGQRDRFVPCNTWRVYVHASGWLDVEDE